MNNQQPDIVQIVTERGLIACFLSIDNPLDDLDDHPVNTVTTWRAGITYRFIHKYQQQHHNTQFLIARVKCLELGCCP